MRELYPPIEAFAHEMISVSALHTLYVEQVGREDGIPILLLHGGPGGGIIPDLRRFFDPQKWRVILFDQRGCGKSTPHAELRENTTWDLVDDIEKIRAHFKIERWAVFGGSWGSTLALAYAQKFPERCLALFLRGIFLLRKKEIDWFYREGTSKIYPDAWESFVKPVSHVGPEQYVEEYYKILCGKDAKKRIEAARAWSVWEGTTVKLHVDAEHVAQADEEHFAEAFARIECHYFINKGWFKHDDQLLRDAHKLRSIPGVIVHGRYDVVCPVENAWDLKKLWPETELSIIQDAGHSVFEPGIRSCLIEALDRFTPK